MDIRIAEISKDEIPILMNLVKMYCYEWSQYNLFDVDEKGEYPYEKYVPLGFGMPRRRHFFVRADGKLAGFAFIDPDFAVHKDYDYSMGEFFVMHKYRRHGVGRTLAVTLFDRFPGKWEVGFHPHNVTSEKFWMRVVSDYTNGRYTLNRDCAGLHYNDGTLGCVLSFDNSPKPSEG